MWGGLRIGMAARLEGHSPRVLTQPFQLNYCLLFTHGPIRIALIRKLAPRPTEVYSKHRRDNMSTLGNPPGFTHPHTARLQSL